MSHQPREGRGGGKQRQTGSLRIKQTEKKRNRLGRERRQGVQNEWRDVLRQNRKREIGTETREIWLKEEKETQVKRERLGRQ